MNKETQTIEMKEPQMSMWVFKEYRDRHPGAYRKGYSYIRYFGRVDGEEYSDCIIRARKLLGASNRGHVYLVWQWLKTNYGAVGLFRKGLTEKEYPSADETLDLEALKWINDTVSITQRILKKEID